MSELRGIDVSSWQHPDGKAIDWWAAWDVGYRFVLVKSSQGASYVNPWLRQDYDDARAAGFLVGAYHYVEMGVDGAEQGRHAIAAAMGLQLELGLWLDWEPSGELTFAESATYQALAATVWETRHDAGTYTSLEGFAALAAKSCTWRRRWVADWTVSPELPAPFLWQDEGGVEVAGVPAPCDVDVLTSTRGVNLLTGPRPRAVEPAPRPAEVVTAETATPAGGDAEPDEVAPAAPAGT